MSNEIKRASEIEVKLNYEDFRRIFFLLSWQRFWLFWVILPLTAVFLAIAIFSSGTITSPFAYLSPFFPLVILAFLAYNIIASAKAKAAQAQKVRYIFLDEYVQIEVPEVNKKIDWNSFVSFSETKSDFILIEANSQIYQLPKRCFSAKNLSDFKDIVNRKMNRT